ncbi:MAG: glycosyltransferase family 4 protein [Thermodesulfobacteriota bacterium]|nr:glycosyltransferase family 4 protein [Thermodesulfobacteriota bacterium]
MKKLLILNYEYPPLGGGGGRVSHSLAKGFKQKGYEVDVITSKFKGLPNFETVDGIQIHRVAIWGRIKKQTATFLSMFFFLFFAFLCGVSLCSKNKYDFINTHFVVPTGPLGFLLSKLFHLKNILSIHGGDIYDPSKKSSPHNSFYLRWIVSFLLNQSNQIVAQSSNTKQNANRYYKPKKKINIIPLSYEPFNFNPASRADLGLKKDKSYLISVGRIIKRKGLDFLISSLEFLNDDVELLIVGEGYEKVYLYELARKLQLIDRVHFLGEISEELKFQYLSNADIYVLSSLHEGFGIVLQEAMQVGLPIVSTNNGGQVDIVKHRVNGLLVEACNAEALAKAIKELLMDKKLYRCISLNNVEALKEFNTNNIISSYLELI